MLKKLLKEIFSQKGIGLLMFLGALAHVCLVSLPYFGKIFIELIEAKNIGKEFYILLVSGILIGIVGILLGTISTFIQKGIIAKFEINKNIYYFKKFLNLDYSIRNNEGTGKTITKINRGISAQTTLFNKIVDAILIVGVRIITILIVVFTVYKSVMILMIICVFILFFTAKFAGKKLKPLTEKEQEIYEDTSRQSNKIVMESNLINISNKQDSELNSLKNLFGDFPNIQKKIFFFNTVNYDIMFLLFQALEFLSYLFIGLLIVKSKMSVGDLFLIVGYIWMLWWPIEVLLSNAAEYRNQLSKYEALEDFINQKNKIIDGEENFNFKSGEIVFDNIGFGYKEKSGIFENFNLKIEGGKTTALVGHSGSGKSTLIKLLLRNYLLNSGKILVDGQDLKDLKISTFYSEIGYLSQEPAIFDGTIKDNILYGINDKSPNPLIRGEINSKEEENEDNEIWEVLKKVELYDLFKNTEKGLYTEVGEKGIKLSGGERQRIAIARIFLKDPKILILDEPTSALDSISENKITNIINDVMKNRTVIVIAHRLQTVMHADNIIVLEKGKIIESGKHEELMKNGLTYSTLVDLQKGCIVE